MPRLPYLRVVSVDGDFVTVLVGRSEHVDVFNPAGQFDSANDGREEFEVQINPATREGSFVRQTKLVGRIDATNVCDEAVRFASL